MSEIIKSSFSIKEATGDVEKMVKKEKELGGTSLIIADDNFSSLIPFYQACKNENIKPIVGLDATIYGVNFIVVAKNAEGYHFLIERYSTKLRVKDLLNENLSVIIKDFKHTKNLNKVLSMLPKAYIGIFSYKDPEMYIRARHLYSVRKGRKIVILDIATHIKEADYRNTIAIKAILNKTSFNKENVIYDNFFMREIEGNPEWLKNMQELKDACIDDYKFGDPTPPKYAFTKEESVKLGLPNNTTDAELFAFVSKKGLEKRLLLIPEEKHPTYKARLEVEINIINEMGFPGYMLIVGDFVQAARDMNIPVGPGRGSAAGSLVAFAMGITNIDPMPYNLLFERFLNPERVSMPDIDMDFCQSRREEVIDYVKEKYGEEQVAQIVTFGKLKPRGTIRDLSRIFGYNLKLADFFAKTIPDTPGTTFADAYSAKKTEIDAIITDPVAKKVWYTAIALDGLNRQKGVHAAGVVITDVPVRKKVATMIVNKKRVVACEGKDTEELDLIKFDFLGLKTLTVIDDALKMIKKNYDKDIDIDNIDFNDQDVYPQIQAGNTEGLFQIESDGMQGLCSSLKPDCFEDIIAALALYRPGPMESGMLDDFVARKNGDKEVKYFFDEYTEILKPILEPTYGVIVYQEQVMQIVQEIGGFSLGEADIVRRAMGKKKDMSIYTNKFADGAHKKGLNRDNAVELFHKIEEFAGYGFNKSHSAAYAMVTLQTAYLKHYYPGEFMSALMNHNDTDKVAKYIDASREMGLEVLNPDINTSRINFETDDGKTIFYSISVLKGVGKGAAKVVKEREKNGLFTQVDGYTGRYEKMSKATFKALVNSGAFDQLSPVRKPLIDEDATEDYTLKEKLEIELDVLGYYLSDPFEKLKAYLSPYYIPTLDDLEEGKNSVLVFPQDLIERTAKKTGKTFAILTAFFVGGKVKEIPAFNDSVSKLSIIDMKDPRPFILKVSKKGDSLFLNDVIKLGKQALENNFMKV